VKYKNGIFIGKFYPLHFGHISTIKTLSLRCENVYVLFYYNKKDEERLKESFDYEYNIQDRISDCKYILNDNNIHVLKLEVDDNRKFPENKESILNKIKEIIKDNLDVQIFGGEEYEIYTPYRYTQEYITSSPYMVEDENGEIVSLHASLIRKNYDYYKKYIPKIIRDRIDIIKR
jgi:HTH-type transcriptional repressor of NAD biosynthesis genes